MRLCELPEVVKLIEKYKAEKELIDLDRIINTMVYSSGFEKIIESSTKERLANKLHPQN